MREGNLTRRADAQTAYRLHLAFLLHLKEKGLPDEIEMSVEAEAGSLLEAEMAHNIHTLRMYYEKAHT